MGGGRVASVTPLSNHCDLKLLSIRIRCDRGQSGCLNLVVNFYGRVIPVGQKAVSTGYPFGDLTAP